MMNLRVLVEKTPDRLLPVLRTRGQAKPTLRSNSISQQARLIDTSESRRVSLRTLRCDPISQQAMQSIAQKEKLNSSDKRDL